MRIHNISIDRKQTATGAEAWIAIQEPVPRPWPIEPPEASGGARRPYPLRSRVALLTADFDQALSWLAPLQTTRSLGWLDRGTLEAIELYEEKYPYEPLQSDLVIFCRRYERPISYKVGAETPDRRDVYVRDSFAGNVFVIERARWIALHYAVDSWFEYALHPFALAQVDGVVLTHDGTSTRFPHTTKGNTPPGWSAGTGSTPSLRDDWISRVFRVNVEQYFAEIEPGEDLIVPHGQPQALFELRYEAAGKLLGNVALTRVDTKTHGAFYYARTDRSDLLMAVDVEAAAGIERDLDAILGEAAAAPGPAP